MEYTKPEIVSVAKTLDAIQGIPKGAVGTEGTCPNRQTITAYEADE